MARPQPFTLWRSVFGELGRTLLLASAVLVSVIAFAATIKPLADGRLAPLDAIKFMLLAIPPMLAYALPFAGCFASTLVYHRLSADNEFVAAASGGVSHRSLLVPAAILGIVLFGGMVLLNEQIIPRFLGTMQTMITQDLAKILANSINRGQSVEMKKLVVFADKAQPVDLEPGSGATTALVLARPAVIERDEDGNIESEGTASRATLWVFPEPGTSDSGPTTRLAMRLEDFTSKDSKTGLVTGRTLPLSITMPSSLSDDPKFLRNDELRDLSTRPERMGWIDQRRRRLANELALSRAVDEMTRSFSRSGSFNLVDSAGRPVIIRAAAVKSSGKHSWTILPGPDGNIEVDLLRRESTPARAGGVRHTAKSVFLTPDTGEERPAGQLVFRLEMRDVASGQLAEPGAPAPAEATKRERLSLPGLIAPKGHLAGLLDLNTYQLLEEADKNRKNEPGVIWETNELRRELAALRDEVTAKQNERMAVAFSCLVMLFTGAVTALRFSRSLPLTVYLWSFFPALVCVITISGGQQLTRSHGWPGLLLLWGGVAVLALYTFYTYLVVRKH